MWYGLYMYVYISRTYIALSWPVLKEVGLAPRSERQWNATIQKRTSGRSSAAWRFLVTTSDAVSYKVRVFTFLFLLNELFESSVPNWSVVSLQASYMWSAASVTKGWSCDPRRCMTPCPAGGARCQSWWHVGPTWAWPASITASMRWVAGMRHWVHWRQWRNTVRKR